MHILVVDPSKDDFDRVEPRLQKSGLMGSVVSCPTLEKVRDHLANFDTDVIFIDPRALGVEPASEFIFEARRRMPGLVFALYTDIPRARKTPGFFGGERARLYHYYKLDKSLDGIEFEEACTFALHQCLSDLRNDFSFRRAVAQREFAASAYTPVEISESLAAFRAEHRGRSAFIMMQFGETESHDRITTAIRSALAVYDIQALRADDREYHPDLLPNVLTYAYGCTFGVAVFERIEEETQNPNVALEVGYLMGMKKPVCLLKDRTLQTLQSDLVGKLYKEFDPHAPKADIERGLAKWIAGQAFANGG